MHRKKSNISQIMLSVVALLLISIIAFGATFSWIEGGTKLIIRTAKGSPLKTSDAPQVGGTITIDPDTSNDIELLTYDEVSGYYKSLSGEVFKDVHFSPMSGDGNNFYFPIGTDVNGEEIFRKANTNDIGTKYIDFEFKVKAAKKCYLTLSGDQSITVKKGNVTETFNDSVFRFFISDGNSDSYMFSTDTTERAYITDTNGTQAFYTDFKSISDYKNLADSSNQKLFMFEANEIKTIRVAVWLDYLDSKLDANSGIFGGDVTINLKFAAAQEKFKVNFYAPTVNNAGTALAAYSGGSITVGAQKHTSAFSQQYTLDSTVTATATANQGYDFAGWFSDESCSEESRLTAANVTELSYKPTDVASGKVYNLYAKFEKSANTTIYFEARSDYEKMYAFIYNKTTESTLYPDAQKAWPGTQIFADNVTGTGYYYISFETEDVGQFRVIVNDGAGNQYPGNNQPGLEGTLGGTYLFTSEGSLVDFNVADATLTFTAVSSNPTYGSVKVNDSTEYTTVKIRPGDDVKITSAPKSTGKHDGWYSNSGLTTKINDNYMTHKQVVTISGSAGQTVTYRAKHIAIPQITVYFTNSDNWSGTIRCHYWNDSAGTSTEWPGVAMTYVDTNNQNQKRYKITIPGDSSGFLFTNGSVQTKDITDMTTNKGYWVNGYDNNDKKYTVGSYDI